MYVYIKRPLKMFNIYIYIYIYIYINYLLKKLFKLVNTHYKRTKKSFKIIFTITIECVHFCLKIDLYNY